MNDLPREGGSLRSMKPRVNEGAIPHCGKHFSLHAGGVASPEAWMLHIYASKKFSIYHGTEIQ